MGDRPQDDATLVLQRLGQGEPGAADRLLGLVYDELHDLAERALKHERPGHTLQPTALVHEAYLKLIDQTRVEWQNRAHFIGVAAQAMRRVLVDHARKRLAAKRGGHRQRITLSAADGLPGKKDLDLLALEEALQKLAKLSERQVRVIELRFFGGLTIEEAAQTLGVSTTTVEDDWSVARAWLRREMSDS